MNKSIFIPKGFAHGYLSLDDDTEINYKVDNYYNPNSENGISFSDKHLKINWGVDVSNVLISEKDIKLADYQW